MSGEHYATNIVFIPYRASLFVFSYYFEDTFDISKFYCPIVIGDCEAMVIVPVLLENGVTVYAV
jgi:hypothetical protein